MNVQVRFLPSSCVRRMERWRTKNRVVEAGENEDTKENMIWYLSDDISNQKGFPAVGLGGPLSFFIE